MYHTSGQNIQIFAILVFTKFFRFCHRAICGIIDYRRMGNVTKKIKFVALTRYDSEVCPKPTPAINHLPDWWRDSTPYIKSEKNPTGKKLMIKDYESNASFKKCTPMLDLLGAGYIVTLWADVLIEEFDIGVGLKWRVQKPLFENQIMDGVAVPEGYHENGFKFMNRWVPQLPKGYSALIIPPVGHPNGIFRPLPAIIDYDATPHPLFPPGFIKKDFNGILEKGTPMFQIIPFKRDNWESSFDFFEDDYGDIIRDKFIKATIVNNYIKNFWTKKSFK
jgi:hypothetical protein